MNGNDLTRNLMRFEFVGSKTKSINYAGEILARLPSYFHYYLIFSYYIVHLCMAQRHTQHTLFCMVYTCHIIYYLYYNRLIE